MKPPIRVLFASRLDFGLRIGGVQMQVERIREALGLLGVDVALCNPWQDSLKNVDVCHLFTTAAELFPYAKTAQHRGIPLVITPIMNSAAPAWRMRIQTRLLTRLPGVYTQLRLARGLLSAANAILPLTSEEAMFLTEVFDVPSARMHVVPNGVESRFGQATPGLFIEKFGFRPDVLFVGRIDRNKNVLSLIDALVGTGLKLAIIGFPYVDEPQVFEMLERRLGAQVTYVGSLQHADPLLASAYAAAKVFCLPSFKEVMPLTVLEALAAGSRAVLTTNSAMNAFLGNAVHYADPSNVTDIRKQILAAYQSEPPCELRERLLETCTWEKVGMAVREVYTDLLHARESSGSGVKMGTSRVGVNTTGGPAGANQHQMGGMYA